jgi:hypothetical protein
MTEMVIAVFETASAADAAVQDLDVARIPSAVIRRGMRDDRTLPDNRSTSGRQSKRGYDLSSVTVAVDEMHAAAVTGILNQYGPLEIEERADRARI